MLKKKQLDKVPLSKPSLSLTLNTLPLYCSAGTTRMNKPATMAASHPNVCNVPCLLAHGIWKYATLKPPSVRARLIKADISPYRKTCYKLLSARENNINRTYLELWEAVIAVCI
jgi:hypothetical protein